MGFYINRPWKNHSMIHNIINLLFLLTNISTAYGLNTSTFENSRPPLTFKLPPAVQFRPHGLEGDAPEMSDHGRDVFDVSQADVDPEKFGGINIRAEAETLSKKLQQISNEELKTSVMQGIYDSYSYKDVVVDYDKELDEMWRRLRTPMDQYLQILSTTRMTADDLYLLHLSQAVNYPHPCCSITKSELKYDDRYEMNLSHDMSCDLIPHSLTGGHVFNPGRNLTEVFQHNVQYISTITWQYFISADGIQNEFPAQNYPKLSFTDCINQHNIRNQGVLLSTMYPWQKNVVLVIDNGNSLSGKQRQLAKSLAKYIIDTLGVNDRVGVISMSSTVQYPHDSLCRVMRPLSTEYRLQLLSFIDSLDKLLEATNHSLAFSAAYDMIRSTFTESGDGPGGVEDVLILYISRGLLSALTEARDVLSTIKHESSLTPHTVIINTYAVIDESKPVMYEKTFLTDVALQNFTKYQVNLTGPAVQPRRGVMTAVSSVRDYSVLAVHMFQSFNWTTNTRPVVGLPRYDTLGQGLVMPVTWPCVYNTQLIGIVGFDVPMEYIVESVTYSRVLGGGYAFLMDCSGNVIVHPSIDESTARSNPTQPVYSGIELFERAEEFSAVKLKMIRVATGCESILMNVTTSDNNVTLVNVTYRWRHVSLSQMDGCLFIVALRIMGNRTTERHLVATPAVGGANVNLMYHRLDLFPPEITCMHFIQLATPDSSTFFLTANAFIHPYEHLSQKETKRIIQGFLAYLRDNTDLISNPGILAHVRDEIIAMQIINSDWKSRSRLSRLREYIVRRYVATLNGAVSMYPGTLLDKNIDFTNRPWYSRSLEHPGRITLTAPYLDIGGAGYIVTISHTVYEGRQVSQHSPMDRVVAVMGVDFTMKYFYKILIDQMPVCDTPNIRCFIMDDRGYLIAHDGLIEPNSQGPPEQKHITHKEPLVTNDILKHRGFVIKKACVSFTDRTVQRYYQFNTGFKGVITNLVHGEHCARYQVTAIPGTNVFLGMVNKTCDAIRAFCPCSMVDRLCLNCVRMEQTECECPCECPLHADICSQGGQTTSTSSNLPVCQRNVEDIQPVKLNEEIGKVLPQCFLFNCSAKQTKSECIGVLDCEWCELDKNGLAPLLHPYCSTQRVCFGGVLAAVSPYNNHVTTFTSSLSIDASVFKSIPVGPIAGGIMGCFLLFALGIYCYRHHTHSSRYTDSLPDGQTGRLRDSANDNEFEEIDDTHGGHTNVVLSTFENPANINPYFVNTSYRRPTVAESDLGYSSIATGGDCELASSSCVDSVVGCRDLASNGVPSPATKNLDSSRSGTSVLSSDSGIDDIAVLTDDQRKHGNSAVGSDRQRADNTILPLNKLRGSSAVLSYNQKRLGNVDRQGVGSNVDKQRGGSTLLPLGKELCDGITDFPLGKELPDRMTDDRGNRYSAIPSQTVIGELSSLLPHQVIASVQVHSVEAL